MSTWTDTHYPLVRLAMPEDEAGFLALAERHLAKVRPDLEYDEGIARATFHASLRDMATTIYVAEARDRTLVGCMVGTIRRYPTAGANAVALDAIYVLPEFRASDAGRQLLEEFWSWGVRLNAADIIVEEPVRRRGRIRRLITTMGRSLGRHLTTLKA